MRKSLIITLLVALLSACTFNFGADKDDEKNLIEVVRYDRVEASYLTTGDFAAMQTLSTEYPMETRTLVEDVLHIGEVNDREINAKLLKFYQDSTLQTIISDVQREYANMNDINRQLSVCFKRLQKLVPEMTIPQVYAQIGALDQSIVVGYETIGISLDKYLGKDYNIYKRYYPEDARQQMTRDNIVPDCLTFYLLSLYPLADFEHATQEERDTHIGRVFWVVNKAMDERFYTIPSLVQAEEYMKKHPRTSIEEFLLSK